MARYLTDNLLRLTWVVLLGALLGLAGCLPSGDDGGDGDTIADQPIIGTGRGLVATYANSRNRCSFRQRTSPSEFDLQCRIVVAVGGNEIAAVSRAKDVTFDWEEPVGVEGAEVTVRGCLVPQDRLSQDCIVAVHNPNGTNKVRVDVQVQRVNPVTAQLLEARTESRTVMLAYGAFTEGLIPHVPLSFRPNPEEVSLLDGILDIFGLGDVKVAEVGYQARSFDPLQFRFDGITSTCQGAEGLYFATAHYVYLRNKITNKVSVFVGNPSPTNQFSLVTALNDVPGLGNLSNRDDVNRLWRHVYPADVRFGTPGNAEIGAAIVQRLGDFRRHRLQLALGKRVRLACHPSKPGTVFLLESFDSIQANRDFQSPEIDQAQSTRHRLWKAEGDQMRLLVMDWGMEETQDWHFVDPGGPNMGDYEEQGRFTLAPPRAPATAIAARFEAVMDIAAGTDGSLYLADSNDHRIRVIRPDGKIHSFAGRGLVPLTTGNSACSGPLETAPVDCAYELPRPSTSYPALQNEPALQAILVRPLGLGIGNRGELYVTTVNGLVRVEDGLVSLVNSQKWLDVAVQSNGTLIGSTWAPSQLKDISNNTVLATRDHLMHSLTGFGDSVAFALATPPETTAFLSVGSDSFLSQNELSRIFPREVLRGEIATWNAPQMVPIVGASPETRLYPVDGQSLPIENLQLPEIVDLETARDGRLFFIGDQTHSVFVIESKDGVRVVRHLIGVGNPDLCEDPQGPDGLFGMDANNPLAPKLVALSYPRGLGLDSQGNLFVADTGNNRILKFTPDQRVYQVAGMGCAKKAVNPYHTKVPRNRSTIGPGTINCIDSAYNCARSSEEGNACPEESIPECQPPAIDAELACTEDAHVWRPTEVAIWEQQLYILLYERNAILRIDLNETNPQPRLSINDPWGIENLIAHRGEAGYTDRWEYSGSIHCPKVGRIRQIVDIAVDAENALYVADYKTRSSLFRFTPSDLQNLPVNPAPSAQSENLISPAPFMISVANAPQTIGERHPIAIAPNANGGIYGIYSKPTEQEGQNLIEVADPNFQPTGDDGEVYFFPVQGGEALLSLVPDPQGLRAHVLADQLEGGNKDCGSGVISGKAERKDLDSALKASIATLCRSYAQTIASYPECTNDGKRSGFALPQSFSNSIIYNASLWGATNSPVDRGTTAPAANILQVQTPCLIE